MISHWNPGDPVLLRDASRRQVWWAMPATVVRDTPDLIALYWRVGTPSKHPARRLTAQDLVSGRPELVDGTWVRTDVLALVTPGAAHAVYAMWEEGQTSLHCWYVNLQDPLRRTALGFDTTDHALDVVISPDRSEWWWKDEDEFREDVAAGVFSPEEARAIRAEGERVIGLLQANAPPFCDGWEHWSPPPEWKLPALPPGWDDVTA